MRESRYIRGRGVSPPQAFFTLQRLRVTAEQCLFVDDMEKNVAAARALGMGGMLFTDAGSLERELRARLAGWDSRS